MRGIAVAGLILAELADLYCRDLMDGEEVVNMPAEERRNIKYRCVPPPPPPPTHCTWIPTGLGITS